MTDFEKELSAAKALVEKRLAEFFPGDGLQAAMRYSLLAGGKRIRPILAMKFCEAARRRHVGSVGFRLRCGNGCTPIR